MVRKAFLTMLEMCVHDIQLQTRKYRLGLIDLEKLVLSQILKNIFRIIVETNAR